MQPEYAEDPVQHVGDPGKVAGVFKDGDSEEHEQNQRYKSQHTAYAINDSREDQRFEKSFRKMRRHQAANPAKNALHPSHRPFAIGECEVVKPQEDGKHNQRPKEPMCQEPVDLIGCIEPVWILLPADYVLLEQTWI